MSNIYYWNTIENNYDKSSIKYMHDELNILKYYLLTHVIHAYLLI